MGTFLLVFNANQMVRRDVTEHLDAIDEVHDWVAFFDNSLCVVSPLSVDRLSKRLREALPDLQFILSELEEGKRNGWLPRSVWKFLRASSGSHENTAAE